MARPGTERLECVEERAAIANLLDFLEAAGPGVILVGMLLLVSEIIFILFCRCVLMRTLFLSW